MFLRTRTSIQILLTLFSFFGFNEAVLAVRYRNILHLGNIDIRMILSESTSCSSAEQGNSKTNESPLELTEYQLDSLVIHDFLSGRHK